MDGRSFAHLLLTESALIPAAPSALLAAQQVASHAGSAAAAAAVVAAPWRTELLIEYGAGGPVVSGCYAHGTVRSDGVMALWQLHDLPLF
jgi:hypothetical protein